MVLVLLALISTNCSTSGAKGTLTPVLGPQAKHEAQGEGLGPGGFGSQDQDPEEEGLAGQRETVQGLEGRADVEEPGVLFATQQASAHRGVAEVI